MKANTEAKWVERIRAWRESGLSAREFTEGTGFAEATLRWWASKLAKRSEPGVVPVGRAVKRRKEPTVRVAMARVVRRPLAEDVPIAVEVGGARIAVRRGFDAGLLSQVVAALGGSR